MSLKTIEIPQREISRFCERWHVAELALFGSSLRDDFSTASDIDLLISAATGARWKLEDLIQMKEELEELFGRKVDLVQKRLVEKSPNYIRREEILKTARVIYVA